MRNKVDVTPMKPLEGITVVELGHSVAAPYAGLILADLGARVIKAPDHEAFTQALSAAKDIHAGPVCIVAEVDRNERLSDNESWWDVAVAEVSTRPDVQNARAAYEQAKQSERYYL